MSRILGLNYKILIVMTHDAVISVLAFAMAIFLKFETFNLAQLGLKSVYPMAGIIIGSQIFFFNLVGLYKGIWRFSSTTDLVTIFKATGYGTVLPLICLFIWNRLEGFPRSLIIIDYVLLILGLGGGRFIYRLWSDSFFSMKITKKMKVTNKTKVLVVGAGSAGNQLVREIKSNPKLGLYIVGFIDDNPLKLSKSIQGISVLGSVDNLSELIEEHKVKQVLISIPSAKSTEIKRIIKSCEGIEVELKVLPKINDILGGKIQFSQLRNINLEDLLGRDPINLDYDKLAQFIDSHPIMVTGAGGSIGSELSLQIARFNPEKIILFELCEFFLYQLENKIRELFPNVEIVTIIGDVRHRERLRQVVEEYRPHAIIHAAAYKHVPMMEKNPIEAIKTNILGTKVVAEAANDFQIKNFVMVSTDKAVNPTNIMGATKRIAEMVCQYYNEQSDTQYMIVRFGNVLGSNGSVIPLFKHQIESGGPLTVTHPEMTRFFMSIPEACQLILQSAAMGSGGEIFVLNMGKSVKIIDLARDLIKLSGLEPDVDIEIQFTGLRPGEKLYEELFSQSETLANTEHDKVRRAYPTKLNENFEEQLAGLKLLDERTHSKEDIYIQVKDILTEFSPSELSLTEPTSC